MVTALMLASEPYGPGILCQVALVVVFAATGAGCAGQPPRATAVAPVPSTSAPVATPAKRTLPSSVVDPIPADVSPQARSAPDGPPRDVTGGERPGRSALTTADIYAPFTPSAYHSVIEADAVPWTPHRIHSYRGRDDLPALRALSPVLADSHSLTVVPEAVRVQTEPHALVAAWADQLGSFCTGSRGILVRADAAGIAVIDIKTGIDAGAYPIFVASPSRSGLLVFTVGAR